jgi:hypothetical protein
VFGADAAAGAVEDFTAVGNETPQDQDILVVRLFTLLAKTAKLRDTFIDTPSPAKTFLTLFRHVKNSNPKTQMSNPNVKTVNVTPVRSDI